MKYTHVILLTVIIGALLLSPVTAQPTMTFRDMNVLPGGYQSFGIYQVNINGTNFLGIYNSTSESLLIDPNSSYILQFVPSTSDYLADPMLGTTDLLDYFTSHFPAMVVFFFIVCLCCIAIYLAKRR